MLAFGGRSFQSRRREFWKSDTSFPPPPLLLLVALAGEAERKKRRKKFLAGFDPELFGEDGEREKESTDLNRKRWKKREKKREKKEG